MGNKENISGLEIILSKKSLNPMDNDWLFYDGEDFLDDDDWQDDDEEEDFLDDGDF